MTGIYKITSPTGRVYVGQSVDLKRRIRSYRLLNCKKQHKLYNSFIKYGVENHVFNIIEECSLEQLNERERYWQDYYDVINFGLNCKLTETIDKSGVFSDDIKNKISKSKIGNKSMLGKKHSEETKEKMRKRALGRTISNEHKAIISEFRKGKKLSQEHKDKISKSMTGKKLSLTKKQRDNISKRSSNLFSKKVIDLNDLKIYKSAKEYSEIKNVDYNKVRNILNKKVKNIYNIIKHEEYIKLSVPC